MYLEEDPCDDPGYQPNRRPAEQLVRLEDLSDEQLDNLAVRLYDSAPSTSTDSSAFDWLCCRLSLVFTRRVTRGDSFRAGLLLSALDCYLGGHPGGLRRAGPLRGGLAYLAGLGYTTPDFDCYSA